MGIQNRPSEQVLGSSGLAQGKSFLLNKFSSLNQRVKQTRALGRLGTFSKPDVKVNFLKPTMHVNLWKSDSSLETSDGNPGTAARKDLCDDRSEISSDSDSYNSDPEQPRAGSLENVDYVLPSCGIVVSAPRLASRSQSIGSVELNVPSVVRVAGCDVKHGELAKTSPDDPSPGTASEAEEAILIDFGTPIDAYCHRFVQDAQVQPALDAQARPIQVFGEQQQVVGASSQNPPVPPHSGATQGGQPGPAPQEPQIPPRPSQLDVESPSSDSNLLTVQKPTSAASGGSLRSLGSQVDVPSPADSNGSRVVSPFAKIRSSMVQVASLTQAGLTQGINFAVAKVQKSPDPDAVNETQESDMKAMFTQCQTRIIQI